jgi:hypothetical protein
MFLQPVRVVLRPAKSLGYVGTIKKLNHRYHTYKEKK